MANGPVTSRSFSPIASLLMLVGLIGALLLPGGADAGRPRSPYWAVVAADGSLIQRNGAVSAVRSSAGIYEVSFGTTKGPLDVSDCAYTATLIFFFGFVATDTLNGEPDVVRVYTSNQSATLADQPFHLVVNCPR